jgi:ABC-type glycerol-3-phosphate transport system substrate-binding protein
MVILDTCSAAQAAYDFLRHVTGPEVQARWAEELEQIPVNLDAFARVDTSTKPELRSFMEQIRGAVPRPNVMKLTEFDEIIGAEMELALSGQRTPEDALRRMAERIEREVLVGP